MKKSGWTCRHWSTGFPRTRGDRPLRDRAHVRLQRQGSPAHAGIDPHVQIWQDPRLSDGSPAHAGIDPSILSVEVRRGSLGSPAHAGIDQSIVARCLRGDGRSRSPALCFRSHGSPAHAGIDPRLTERDRQSSYTNGSPAHAGIDPRVMSTFRRSLNGFPRTRGDRPAGGMFTLGSARHSGSPAHAGIDPSPRWIVPRTGLHAVPPHTRG